MIANFSILWHVNVNRFFLNFSLGVHVGGKINPVLLIQVTITQVKKLKPIRFNHLD